MKPLAPRRIAGLLFPLVLVAVGVVASCQLFGGDTPLASPRIEWVRADRATFDAIGEKFRSYVNDDPAFAVDPSGRAIWLSAIDDWEARLESVEESIAPAEEGGED